MKRPLAFEYCTHSIPRILNQVKLLLAYPGHVEHQNFIRAPSLNEGQVSTISVSKVTSDQAFIYVLYGLPEIEYIKLFSISIKT